MLKEFVQNHGLVAQTDGANLVQEVDRVKITPFGSTKLFQNVISSHTLLFTITEKIQVTKFISR